MTGTGDGAAERRPWHGAAERRPWPDAVDGLLAEAGLDRSRPTAGTGIGLVAGVDRWTVGTAHVYRFGPDRSDRRARFVPWLGRLADVAPFEVPRVVGEIDGWLVVQSPVGQPAHKPERHADPDDLVMAVGAGMRAMHQLPVATATADYATATADYAADDDENDDDRDASPQGWAAVVELCRRSVEAGRLDTTRLPSPYNRYSPADLLGLFLDAGAGRSDSAVDQPVLCHGFAAASRFLVDNGRFVGFDRIEAPLVADRHFDLAIVHLSLQHHFGPEAVFRFYEAYGRDPDLVALDRYVLASHLVGRSPIAAPVDQEPTPAAP